jgi:hypothetical protein
MHHNPVQLLATLLHGVSERTYIACAAALFLICVILLYIYVSWLPAALIGIIALGIVLISLVE